MGKRKQYTGIVTSDKMQKTRVVSVTRLSKHPKYGKIIKNSNKFKVHDEKDVSKQGDRVKIEETRPISKDKRYRLLAVIKKAKAAHIAIKEE